MAIFRRKASQQRKRQYLKLFDARISRGDKNVPTFAQWMKNKGWTKKPKVKKVSKKVSKKQETTGSPQTRALTRSLSPSDYRSLKRFKRKGKK